MLKACFTHATSAFVLSFVLVASAQALETDTVTDTTGPTASEVASSLSEDAITERFDFEAVLQQAREGQAEAQYQAGVAFSNGNGTKKDMSKSVFWLEQAALNDHGRAQYHLAVFYAGGLGVKKDLAKSWELGNAARQNGCQNGADLCDYLESNGVVPTR